MVSLEDVRTQAGALEDVCSDVEEGLDVLGTTPAVKVKANKVAQSILYITLDDGCSCGSAWRAIRKAYTSVFALLTEIGALDGDGFLDTETKTGKLVVVALALELRNAVGRIFSGKASQTNFLTFRNENGSGKVSGTEEVENRRNNPDNLGSSVVVGNISAIPTSRGISLCHYQEQLSEPGDTPSPTVLAPTPPSRPCEFLFLQGLYAAIHTVCSEDNPEDGIDGSIWNTNYTNKLAPLKKLILSFLNTFKGGAGDYKMGRLGTMLGMMRGKLQSPMYYSLLGFNAPLLLQRDVLQERDQGSGLYYSEFGPRETLRTLRATKGIIIGGGDGEGMELFNAHVDGLIEIATEARKLELEKVKRAKLRR